VVTDVNVTLAGLSHPYPDDVGALLVGPGGEHTILMADSGGGGPGVSGVNLTFDDAAPTPIPDSSAPASGSYQPTIGTSGASDGCIVPASFPAPAPAGPYGSPSLAAFDNTNPNGIWRLYVIDDTGLGVGSISGGWSLDITTTTSDTTPPTITSSNAGAVYLLNQPVTADYSCADETGGSGLASCTGSVANGSQLNTSTTGRHTYTVNAADKARNTTIKTIAYTVGYTFSGFFTPIANAPTLNTAKAGARVSMKFGLGGNAGLNILAAGYPQSQQIDCTTMAPIGVAASTTTPVGTSLQYNTTTRHYLYPWKTRVAWANTCRQFDLEFNDGSEHVADFQFTT
jgi:hypothetical protein